jgi:1-acyl-sn-glycerol-3-phosphate acyltransferase
MSTIRSIWIWAASSVVILLWLPFLGLVRLSDRDPSRYRTGLWFRRLGCTLTKVNPSWKIEITGYQVDNPRNPYVVVSNHLSLADIPIISCLPWEMKWVAKAELFKLPVTGWMMRMAGDIAVDRSDSRSRARVLVLASEYIRKRCSVMFFPEGTRSRDGRMLRFTDGAFRLAIRECVPVLPLAIDGTEEALPKNNWRFGGPRTIRVHVLPPVDTVGLVEEDIERLRDEIRSMILAKVADWRGVPVTSIDAVRDSLAEMRQPEG